MPNIRVGALFGLILCIGAIAPATAQTKEPSDGRAALTQALSEITPTDWSRSSPRELVERALAHTTQADLSAASAAGSPEAETILAMARDFSLGGYTQDRPEAVRLYALAASRGFAAAQEYLAGHYGDGDGVAANIDTAVRLHRQAADQGFPRAEINLGFLYFQGTGVATDYAEAMRLWRAAADQGNQHGMRNVGMLYEQGLGVPRDIRQAVYWYRKAAQLGFEPAQADLRRLGVGDL